jgi:excisionase family DNA binding protein
MTTSQLPKNDNNQDNNVIFQALSIDQTAKKLGVSSRQVHRLVQSGMIKSRKIGTRRVIAENDLISFFYETAA